MVVAGSSRQEEQDAMNRAQRRSLRRRAAMEAWRASDAAERGWDSAAATSATAGWLGPSAAWHDLLVPDAEEEPPVDGVVPEVRSPAVTGVARLRAAWSRRPVMRFRPPEALPLASEKER
jgi:hypothetical protein